MSVDTVSRVVDSTRVIPKRRNVTRFTRTLLWFTLPCAVVLVLLNVYPVLFAAWQSLHNGTLSDLGPFVGLHNYTLILSTPAFWSAALFTLIFTVVGVLGSWAVGLGLALLLRPHVPASGLWRVLLLLPLVVPPVVSAQISWNLLLATPQSPLPILAHALGFGNVLFLADPTLARIVVCVLRVWMGFPFMMIMLSSALSSIDPSVYEAAKMDGANTWQRFVHITLPMTSRTTYVAWILMTIICVNDYPSIGLLTDGGPANATQTLIVQAYQSAFMDSGFGPGTATGLIVAIVLVIVSVLLFRQTRKTSGDWTIDVNGMYSPDRPAAATRRRRRRADEKTESGPWLRLVLIMVITALVIVPLLPTFACSNPYGGGCGAQDLVGRFQMMFDPSQLTLFGHSLLLTGVTVLVCIAIGAPAGYAIARGRSRAISGFAVLTFSVQSIPVVILLYPFFMLFNQLGMINNLGALQIVYIGIGLGFAVWMFSTYFKTLPIEIEEAAWVDGCSAFGAFFKVVLPNAMPAVISTGMFVFLLAWGDFLVAGALFTIKGESTLALADPGSLLYLIPPLLIFFVFNRYFSLGGVATTFSGR